MGIYGKNTSDMKTKMRKECSMCGDVGFADELFLCSKCGRRWQHKYCSRLYPNLGHGNIVWECDWCSKPPRKAFGHEKYGQAKVMGFKKAKNKGLVVSSSGSHNHRIHDRIQKLENPPQKHYAIELLLEAAKTLEPDFDQKDQNENKTRVYGMAGDEEGYGVVERQACSGKRTVASRRSSSKFEHIHSSRKICSNNLVHHGQRYKLLSDV